MFVVVFVSYMSSFLYFLYYLCTDAFASGTISIVVAVVVVIVVVCNYSWGMFYTSLYERLMLLLLSFFVILLVTVNVSGKKKYENVSCNDTFFSVTFICLAGQMLAVEFAEGHPAF